MRTKLLGTAAALGGFLYLAGSAHAVEILIQLQQLGGGAIGPTTVANSIATPGAAAFVGPFGNFDLNEVVTDGPPTAAPYALNTTAIDSSISGTDCTATCTLQIWVTQIGLTSPPSGAATFHSSLTWNSESGNTPPNGTGVNFSNYVDPNNAQFGITDPLISATGAQSVENGPAGYNDPVANLTNGTFSETEVISMTCFAGGGCLYDDSDQLSLVVPEPASLSLLGGSLLAFGAWRRRRQAAGKA